MTAFSLLLIHVENGVQADLSLFSQQGWGGGSLFPVTNGALTLLIRVNNSLGSCYQFLCLMSKTSQTSQILSLSANM